MKNIEELKAAQAAEIEKTMRLNALEQEVTDRVGFAPNHVHEYPLYGTCGTIAFGAHLSAASDNKLSISSVVQLIEALPPIGLSRLVNGWTTFTPPSYEHSGEKEALTGKFTPVSPVLLEVDCGMTPLHGYAPEVSFRWITEIDRKYYWVQAYVLSFKIVEASFDKEPRRRDDGDGPRRVLRTNLVFRNPWASARLPYPETTGTVDTPPQPFAFTKFSCGDGIVYGHKFVFYREDPAAFDVVAWLKERQFS